MGLARSPFSRARHFVSQTFRNQRTRLLPTRSSASCQDGCCVAPKIQSIGLELSLVPGGDGGVLISLQDMLTGLEFSNLLPLGQPLCTSSILKKLSLTQ